MNAWLLVLVCAAASLFNWLPNCILADDSEIRNLLPDSTVVYVEAKSLDSVLSHPFSKALRESSAFKRVWRLPDVMKVRGGITLFELAIGDKLESLAKSLTFDGFHLAIDKNTQGVVLLAKTESQEWLEAYLQKLVKLARNDAKSKNQPDPIREADYRGIHGYELQKVIVGNIGNILVVTNKRDLGKNIIDRHLDSTADHLANKPLFQNAWSPIGEDESKAPSYRFMKVFVDLDTLRQAGVAKDLLIGKAKDFAGELILGGVLASLQKTSFAVGEFALNANQLEMQLRIPFEKSWTEGSRTFFSGPNGEGYGSSMVGSLGMMANLTAYRNVSELWLRAGDLFDEKVNDQLAQADNTLTTLFSGKDFATDILGAIEPQVQLVAAEQKFELANAPAIQLPSFGLVAKMKDPNMKKEFKRTFQSLIGFLNFAGAMDGKPQLDLDSEAVDGKQLYTATYLRESDKQYENGLPIQFNFSPTLAFEKDLVFITSTSSLAKQITSTSNSQGIGASTQAPYHAMENTSLRVDFGALKRTADLNRNQIVSQNMLEKGHSKAEAEKEIDTLLSLLSLLRTGDAGLRFNEFLRLHLELEFNTDR